MEREQFTFFSSFARAVKRIRKAADRCAAYDAIVNYALYEQEPELDKMPDAAAIAFELIRPVLDNSRKKAENGRTGGKAEAKAKQEPSEGGGEAKPKQTESKPQANRKGGQTAREIEVEYEYEYEKENDSFTLPPKSPERHKRSANGWVQLTDEQYSRLEQDLGSEELARCITYVDELAQSTGNKNKWKDWNMVIRRCSKEGWGKREQPKRSAKYMSTGKQKPLSSDDWDKIMDAI